jgi:photosystem II stability/assembly factor-like uncharacterized protein
LSRLKSPSKLALTTALVLSLILVASVMPAQGTITFGSIWRDLNPTQYTTDVAGTLRGVYVRSGGSGAIGAGDGWAVGGDSGIPIIAHYDGFSWAIYSSPVLNAVWNSVHFCTTPGAPGVGLCSPNGDGSDGWIVGTAGGAAKALYWGGSSWTDVSTGLATYGAANLTSVFLVCHSPPYGTGCPSSASTTGLAYAVGSAGGVGAIFAFNGWPGHSGGWTPQIVSGVSTSQYNSVYMYIDQSGNLAGFAVGNGGVVARLSSGAWTASVISPGANDLESVFVDRGNPADAWAVGEGGQIWHFTTGIWTGFVSPKGTSNNLFSVFLTSTSEGWIFGDQGTILHSTNLGSGNSWLALQTPLQTAVGVGMILFGGSFPAGGNGWAVGSQGVILHTDGSSCGSGVPSPCWGGSTSITQVTSGQELNAVFMVSSTDAWAGGMWDTTSGPSGESLIHWDGSKWHRANVYPYGPSPDIFGIYMLSSSEGWALGGGPPGVDTTPEALKWDGNTWTGQPITSCYCLGIPRSVFMISGGTGGDGWAVGTVGAIWRYQSGTWTFFANPTVNNLNSVFISNPGSNTNAGWAVGNSGTVLKLDLTGVPTWNQITPSPLLGLSPEPNLYGVYFTDSNHGWIVGDHATILTTADGGNTWSGGEYQLTFGTSTIFRSVFVDTYGVGSGNGDGWTVGDDGSGNAVFGHWDGLIWQNWPLNPLPQTYPNEGLALYSVYLKSPVDGFAVGAGVTGTPAPLSGIFHLDPPTIPVQIVTTSAGSTSSYTSTITSTIAPATSSSTSTSTSGGSETQSTSSSTGSSSTTSQQSTSSSQTQTTSSESMVTTTSSLTTPLVTPVIPGFPVESIIAGILVGLAALAIARRRRAARTT